ncbi:hypothetical protein AQJ27_49180 [Streptomyces olivochromogenes]|nr:hypothetical protein AQJ27_49180 [Streptomyces olivochromogenes]
MLERGCTTTQAAWALGLGHYGACTGCRRRRRPRPQRAGAFCWDLEGEAIAFFAQRLSLGLELFVLREEGVEILRATVLGAGKCVEEVFQPSVPISQPEEQSGRTVPTTPTSAPRSCVCLAGVTRTGFYPQEDRDGSVRGGRYQRLGGEFVRRLAAFLEAPGRFQTPERLTEFKKLPPLPARRPARRHHAHAHAQPAVVPRAASAHRVGHRSSRQHAVYGTCS